MYWYIWAFYVFIRWTEYFPNQVSANIPNARKTRKPVLFVMLTIFDTFSFLICLVCLLLFQWFHLKDIRRIFIEVRFRKFDNYWPLLLYHGSADSDIIALEKLPSCGFPFFPMNKKGHLIRPDEEAHLPHTLLRNRERHGKDTFLRVVYFEEDDGEGYDLQIFVAMLHSSDDSHNFPLRI